MTNAISCDNCGTVILFDARNGRESGTGEESAWIKLEVAGNQKVDACTRSCAVELLGDDGPLRPAIDAHLEVITSITKAIREHPGDHDDEED